MEGASAGAPSGEAGPVWGGGTNTVSRWGSSRRSLGCTAGRNEDTLFRIMTALSLGLNTGEGKSASPSVGPVISVCIRNEEHGTMEREV